MYTSLCQGGNAVVVNKRITGYIVYLYMQSRVTWFVIIIIIIVISIIIFISSSSLYSLYLSFSLSLSHILSFSRSFFLVKVKRKRTCVRICIYTDMFVCVYIYTDTNSIRI